MDQYRQTNNIIGIEEAENFWIQQFSENIEPPMIYTDFPYTKKYSKEVYIRKLNPSTSQRLIQISKENDLSLFIVLLTIFKIFLNKYSSNEKITLISPIFDLKNKNFNSFIYIINVLNEENSFGEILLKVKNCVVNCYKYEFFPIQNNLDLLTDFDFAALHAISFSSANIHSIELLDDVNPNLNTVFERDDNNITFTIEFNSSLYREETIEFFIDRYEQIINQIVSNTQVHLNDINYIPNDVKQDILENFNSTKMKFEDEDLLIHQLFERQVLLYPHNTAIATTTEQVNIYDNSKVEYTKIELTYQELNERSNQIAHSLQEKGVTKDTIVGLIVSHPFDVASGILGILKAGGIYLPLDSNNPEDFIRYILNDSNAEHILLDSKYINVIEGLKNNLQKIEIDNIRISGEYSNILDNRIINNDKLACLIYTSGTTGKQKGSLIKHRSLLNYTLWRKQNLEIDNQDVFLQLLSYSFDGFGSNFYSALLSGGTIFFASQERRTDYSYIAAMISKNNITSVSLVPNMLDGIVKASLDDDLKSLKRIVIGGDKCPPKLVERVKSLNSIVKFSNEYGPTEATVTSLCNLDMHSDSTSIIGKPIANVQTYILDKFYNPVDYYSSGELFISGKGISLGYLNNPELNSTKFIKNPYRKDGSILYKTGDQARWLKDGNVEFIGRLDNQVKINGYRVELEHVENAIISVSHIQKTIIVAHKSEDKNPFLCCYYLSDHKLDEQELKMQILDILPYYMVPEYFIQLDELPLTSTGKIDRKNLPIPGEKESSLYEKPVTELEITIAKIMADVLGKENISIHDNFFSLGGDSIKCIQLAAKMNQAGFKFEMRDIYKYPTVAKIIPHLEKSIESFSTKDLDSNIKLSPVQKWFFTKRFKYYNHFNQAVLLEFFKEITIEKLNNIFEIIQKHHDSFQIKFTFTNEGVLQEYDNDFKCVTGEEYDLRNDKDQCSKQLEISNKIQASLDIENGKLMNFCLFHKDSGDKLLIVIHHLVIDALSWRILIEDIDHLLDQQDNSEALKLDLQTSTYQNWTNSLYIYANAEKLLNEKEYWTGGNLGKKAYNEKNNHQNSQFKDISTIGFSLSKEDTDKLLFDIHYPYNSNVNTILIAALNATLIKFENKFNNILTIEAHGREQISEDFNINRTIGWFTSSYPIVLDGGLTDSFSQIISKTKYILEKVPEKGIGYGVLKYLTDEDHKRNLHLLPQYHMGFNYLGEFDNVNKSNHFRISQESTGNPINPDNEAVFSLEFIGLVIDNQLKVELRFDKSLYDEFDIKLLSEGYKENLLAIIKHCMSIKDRILSPLDFTYKNLDQDFISKYEMFDIEDVFPLSPMQSGMYFLSMFDKDQSTYHQQLTFEVHNFVNIDHVERSFNELVKRHQALRSAFVHEDSDEILQVIFRQKYIDFSFKDISKLNEDNKRKEIESLNENDLKLKFDLNNGNLIRVYLLKLDEKKYHFLFSQHHIIMDGWCLGILLHEFREIYSTKTINLPESVSYKNYINWLARQDRKATEQFWKDYLRDYKGLSSFNNIRNDSFQNGVPVKDEFTENLSQDLILQLAKISDEYNITEGSVFQLAWGILLSKYCHKDDVVFGNVVSGRHPEVNGIERMIGLFINTLPLRISINNDKSIIELLKTIQESNINCYNHAWFPLNEIQKLYQDEEPLFNHLIAFENYPLESLEESNSNFNIRNIGLNDYLNYDLEILIIPGKKYKVLFGFNRLVYKESFIRQISLHFIEIIKQITHNPKLKLSEIKTSFDFIKAEIDIKDFADGNFSF